MSGRPSFGILGPLAASGGSGQPLSLSGRKQRELLAVLLLNPNKVLPSSRIADALWGGQPPPSADVTLRTHVSRLRSRLATIGAHDALVTRPSGYGLFVHDDQIDAAQFEHLLGLGQQAVRRSEPARAAQLLMKALELWRGGVLEDLGPPEFAEAEVARLDELRLVALEYHVDAELALGKHLSVVPQLERVVADHPFRERPHCQLMVALYRSGRQADALAVGAAVRRRLADELGVDPGPELRDLENAILRQDPSLTAAGGKRVDTPPAASTKYRPPTPTRALVRRARLIDPLRAGGRRRLILIHGPAGFGKTTLAVQWRAGLIEEGTSVAWLTIDDEDNNVVWLLAHLVEAIRVVRPVPSDELQHALEERGAAAQRYVLTTLINEIDRGAKPVSVVLDDWHRVTDAASIGALAYLLDHGGPHLQVIATSRSRSNLPIGRMRVRDELVEIDAATLRFDTSEARAFLVDLGGLRLDDTAVANLEQTTGGWIAALQLASLSLRDCSDPATLISDMSGRHRPIGEYLAENVLDALDPAMLDFLMATSITERVTAELAAALAGVSNGRALLEEAEDRNLFLRRLDSEGSWFQYHHLFAEFLQRRLERDHPERVTRLHATASRWFAKHELLREAVDHATAAGEAEQAVELIELHGVDLIRQAKVSTFRALISKLPTHMVKRRPRLQLTVAWANAMLQQPVAAHAALDGFEATAGHDRVSEVGLRGARLEANVLRAMLNSWADRTTRVEELVAECLSRPESAPPFLVSVAANVASFVAIWRFDFAAAVRWQLWAAPYHQTENPFSRIYGHCLAGMAAREQLDVDEAERRFREALAMAEQYGGIRHSDAALLPGALLGELLYERGDVDEADRLLDESYEFGSAGGTVEFLILRHAVAARVKAARGDRETAAARLEEGARVAATLQLPRLRAHIDNERWRLGLPVVGRIEYDPLPDGGLGEATAQLRDEAEIRKLFASQPDLALTRTEAWVQRLQPQGRPRALLQANRLLVTALRAAGCTDEAKRLLDALEAQCAELGMHRYLLDG
ncbi:BTAD domain-containing putative transcriptional regulator [Mycobacterium hubeiense]|uniref:BTAD domain-containing putative transcriptional regulator n=1 Tax=Mycobacterium hubeiense TaxID=1867256 RepID=UPI000C7F3008|nr:BTAD domain-containing putative transcriptional regulator [Mycobacterium sp. QGD 101]